MTELTRKEVEAALDKAIGAVIDPVPDCVPKGIVRDIQMDKLTEELNRLLVSRGASAGEGLEELTQLSEAYEIRRLALEEAKNAVAYFFDTHKGEELKAETLLGRLEALATGAMAPAEKETK